MTDTILRRHPIRGILWGLVAGLGAGLLLMVLSLVQLSIPYLAVSTGAGVLFGLIWGTVGPPKKPKGARPATAAPPAHAPEPVAAPLDDANDE